VARISSGSRCCLSVPEFAAASMVAMVSPATKDGRRGVRLPLWASDFNLQSATEVRHASDFQLIARPCRFRPDLEPMGGVRQLFCHNSGPDSGGQLIRDAFADRGVTQRTVWK